MKLFLALALLAWSPLPQAAPPCPAPGDAIHWAVDYCMLKMETDDEIAVSDCIEQQRISRSRDACATKMKLKRRMCDLRIRNYTLAGTRAACVKDPSFRGRTVERGGVGG